MNELQSDVDIVEQDNVIEHDPVETVEENANPVEGAELAPASDGEHEQSTSLNGESQDAVNKRIGELTFKYRQEEREKQELREQLDALKAQQQPQEPQMPVMPDPFEDDYEQKVKLYQDQVRERIAWEESQKVLENQAQQAALASQQRQFEQVQQTAISYNENAKKLGIKQEDLANAGNQVKAYGINNDLAAAILADEQGPLITTHLAANPMELDKIVRMTPVQGAMYIQSNVKPKLQQLKPRETNAPKPPTNIAPTSQNEDKYSHVLGGAKFD